MWRLIKTDKGKVMPSLGVVQKQKDLVESCKDDENFSCQARDYVSVSTFSTTLLDKRPGFLNKVWERNVRQVIQGRKTCDSPSDCDPSSMRMTEDDMVQVVKVKDSLVPNKKCTMVPLTEKCEEKNVLSNVVVAKQVSVTTTNEQDSPPTVGRLRKKLLILDLNGLLADIVSPPPKDYKSDINISRRAIFKRPFLEDFIIFCFERFDVGIWSSRTNKILERVIDYLMGDVKQKLLFCWDLSHCTKTGIKTLENKHKVIVFKELKKIWERDDPNLPWQKGDYNESNTLLLDDSPYKALLNPPHTAIFPYSFKFQDKSDNMLDSRGDLRVYLEVIAGAENIQKYVEEHPFGQKAIDESSSSWGFYLEVINTIHSSPPKE